MDRDQRVQFPERWVRIMCDWGADGVWNRGGAACSVDALPIPPELAAWIRGWQARFEAFRIEDMVKGDLPDEAWHREGRAIAEAVRIVLPDWTVVYE